MSTASEDSLRGLDIDEDIDNGVSEEKPTDSVVDNEEPNDRGVDAIMDELGDVSLFVEEKDIKISRAVLSIASPVFRAMFGPNFKERDQERIDIKGHSYDDFRAFLRCINPHVLEEVTATNVYHILPLVDEYQVESLRGKCHEVLIALVDERSSPSDVFHHLLLAETYSLDPRLKTRCCSLASEFEISEIEECENEYEISTESKLKIRNLALARYDIRRCDDEFMEGIMRSQKPKSFLDIFKERFVKKHGDILQPTNYQEVQLSSGPFGSTPVQFGVPHFPACRISNRTTSDDLLMIRTVYRYFGEDKELTAQCVRHIRSLLQRMSAEDQRVFDLLPECVKHEIRGKNEWTIPP